MRSKRSRSTRRSGASDARYRSHDLVDRRLDRARHSRWQLRHRHKQRRLDDEARLTCVLARERRERAPPVISACPLDDLFERVRELPVVLELQLVEHLCRVQARVPDIEVTQTREVAHCLAICPNTCEHDVRSLGVVEPAVAAGDLEARRESLDVPLERAVKRLVEVVQVEDEIALRRPEAAEVQQVRVAAELCPQPRRCVTGEVPCHHGRSAAEERERRREHPPVADRNQFRHPVCVLCGEDRQRVPVRRQLERPEARARNGGARGPAAGSALLRREPASRWAHRDSTMPRRSTHVMPRIVTRTASISPQVRQRATRPGPRV